MFIFQCTHLLLISLLAMGLLRCHGSCAFFHTTCFLHEFDDEINATLQFTLINNCINENRLVGVIKVKIQDTYLTTPQTMCQVFHDANGTCFPSPGCTCGPVSCQYAASMLVNATGPTLWEISGTLNSGHKIQAQTLEISKTYCTLVSTTVQTLTEDFSSKDVAQVLWRSDTRDLTSSIGPTSSVSQESKTGATDNIDYHKTKVVILVVVAVVVVLIVMVVLVLVFKLWASVKKIKNRPSSTGITRTEPRLAHPRMYPALFNKDLYGGSNVSLMIINDMYVEGPWTAPRDVSRARRPLPAPPGGSKAIAGARAGDGCSSSLCDKEGDYEEINSLFGDRK